MKKINKIFLSFSIFSFIRNQVSLIYLKIQSPEMSMINLLIAEDKTDLRKSTQQHQKQLQQQHHIHFVVNNSFINDYNYDDDYNDVVSDYNHYHRRN